jgi:hypothetical protein
VALYHQADVVVDSPLATHLSRALTCPVPLLVPWLASVGACSDFAASGHLAPHIPVLYSIQESQSSQGIAANLLAKEVT